MTFQSTEYNIVNLNFWAIMKHQEIITKHQQTIKKHHKIFHPILNRCAIGKIGKVEDIIYSQFKSPVINQNYVQSS